MKNRQYVVALALSASALVGLAVHEGYKEKAYIPVAGDVPTIGFGTTGGIRLGDSTDPVRALQRKLSDIQAFEGALKKCVTVPLHQYEYDAYISLSYNIGSSAFCRSTLVRKLNAGDYAGACKEILRWDKFQGKPLRGLTQRRADEYQQCIGAK
jgi:lysozyme